jgi:hypothetical protein
MKEEKRELPNLLFIKSYSNAFRIHLAGSAAVDLIVDFLFLFSGSWFVMFGLGRLPLVEDLYRWTWQAGWWFIPYLVIPLTFTVACIVKNRRSKEGISVLRWIFVRIAFDKRKYTPFSERPTVWKRVRNWVQREEELY